MDVLELWLFYGRNRSFILRFESEEVLVTSSIRKDENTAGPTERDRWLLGMKRDLVPRQWRDSWWKPFHSTSSLEVKRLTTNPLWDSMARRQMPVSGESKANVQERRRKNDGRTHRYAKHIQKWTFTLLFSSRLWNLFPPSSFVTFTPYSTLNHLVTFFSTSQGNEETRIRCLQTIKSFSPRTSTHQRRHDDRSSSSVNPKTRDQIVRIET